MAPNLEACYYIHTVSLFTCVKSSRATVSKVRSFASHYTNWNSSHMTVIAHQRSGGLFQTPHKRLGYFVTSAPEMMGTRMKIFYYDQVAFS